MDGLSELDREQLVRRMRVEFEATMRKVADAVNAAPSGHLIDGSEEQVRDLMGEFRRRVFETAAQMRVEATEVSPAFFPGEGSSDQPGGVGAVGVELQRSDRTASSALGKSERRDRRRGG